MNMSVGSRTKRNRRNISNTQDMMKPGGMEDTDDYDNASISGDDEIQTNKFKYKNAF